MSAYKDALTASMTMLAGDPLTRFLGYGLTKPDSAGLAAGAAGTMVGVPMAQRIETPVAENLMAGLAIGLSLAGLRPLVFYERADFILNALDSIVNHADKIAGMSRGQFAPAVIFRVVVGNRSKPLFTGVTHTREYSDAVSRMVSFPVMALDKPEDVTREYAQALDRMKQGVSTMLFEWKDRW
jgi:pyruvate/2-oxoglutarate/acetoin dehydrogenase E1 component